MGGFTRVQPSALFLTLLADCARLILVPYFSAKPLVIASLLPPPLPPATPLSPKSPLEMNEDFLVRTGRAPNPSSLLGNATTSGGGIST